MQYKKNIIKFVNEKYKKLGLDSVDSIEISHLGTGENNLNLLVIINHKHKFVVRIALRKNIEKNMVNEFKTLQSLPKDLGPKPIYFDDSKKYLPRVFSLQSFIPGKPLKKWSKIYLIAHAKKAAKLHSQRNSYSTFFGKQYSLNKRLIREIKSFKSGRMLTNDDSEINDLRSKIHKLFNQKDYLLKNIKLFSKIHGDLTIGNIFSYKEKLHYIDWEWSRFDDNAFDLAKLYYPDLKLLNWAIKLNPKSEDLFLKQYQKSLSFKDSTLKERINLWQIYIMFTDYIYFKWKLANYNPVENSLPKKYYKKTVELMHKSLHTRFL